MLGEIVVTSPHKEITQIFERFISETDLKVTVLETSFEDAVSVVKSVLLQNPERNWVIISGGATEKLLANELRTIPTVSIEPTEYDVLLAIDNARLYGGKIGLFLAREENMGVIEKISRLLNLPIKGYIYHSWRELENQVELARADGIEVIVGVGERIGALVRQEGLNYVSVLAGNNTIRNSLERAKDILVAEHKLKVNAERLNAVATYSNEGIVAVNEENIITVFNPAALKLFGLKEGEVVGKSLDHLSQNKCLIDILEGPEKKLGFLKKIRDKNILINKVPILDSQSSKGFLVTFKEVHSTLKDEKAARELVTKGLVAKYSFDDIIHTDQNMNALILKAKKYANTDSTVLIRGESGTGKELFAQGIHNGHSVRAKKPFFAVNCASLDNNLLRAELFGYTEGAFTGASKGGKPGLFELANGGTLFLDEIGKMKLELQAHLLRVLQEKEVRRIGSDRVIPVDVRVVAASNEDLKELVNKGVFREDLYFRLNVLKLTIPPLRERKGDITDLVATFLSKNSKMYNKEILSLPPLVLRNIGNMNWPGNVRQLEHFIERCVVLADDENDIPGIVMELLEEEFSLNVAVDGLNPPNKDYISIKVGTLTEMNAEIVRKMSEMAHITNSELALKLGISRPTLIKILNQNKKIYLQSVE